MGVPVTPIAYVPSIPSGTEAAPALRPAHCPLCAFQSACWQSVPQYAATEHLEHFFSGTPVALHDQQLFLAREGNCAAAAAADGKAAATAEFEPAADA